MLEVREMKPPICKGEEMPRISATKSFTATTAALGRTPSPPPPPSFKYYAAPLPPRVISFGRARFVPPLRSYRSAAEMVYRRVAVIQRQKSLSVEENALDQMLEWK